MENLNENRTYINDEENLKKFLNPLYEPNDAVLWPSLFTQSLSLWSNLFLRYQINDKPFIEARGEITKMVEENKQARLKVEKLRKFVAFYFFCCLSFIYFKTRKKKFFLK